MCAANCPGTRFRQSPVFHFTLLEQQRKNTEQEEARLALADAQ